MGEQPTEGEMLSLMRSIEDGSVSLTPLGDKSPQRIYAGVVSYDASDGSHLGVFNDCNEWDYFEWIQLPDGRRADYDDLPPPIRDYSPAAEVAWERYRIPGYLTFRCERCGTQGDATPCEACVDGDTEKK